MLDMLRSILTPPFLFVLLSLLYPFSYASFNSGLSPAQIKGCEFDLKQAGPKLVASTPDQALVQAFSQYSIEPIGENADHGFFLRSPNPDKPVQPKTIIVPSNEWAPPFIEKRKWHYGNGDYVFLDTGFKRFESYSNSLHKIIRDSIVRFPNEDLEFLYGADRVAAAKMSQSFRWALHEAVLRKYKRKKSYLTEKDLSILRELNKISSNNDVFGLFRYDPDLNPADVRDVDNLLLSTIQITYFGDRDFFNPNVRQVERASRLPVDQSQDLLPFAYRLDRDSKKGKSFLKKFNANFSRKDTCEILRYSSFDAKLPLAIEDRLVYDVFRTIVERGMKHIVIGVDNATGRLFSDRYDFMYYDQLPIPIKKQQQVASDNPAGWLFGDLSQPPIPIKYEPEFLYYIDVHSPEFQTVYHRLKVHSDEVMVPGEEQND
jgi:hypothetical protein